MKPEERIDRALENLLSPQELADFQSEVVADPELRTLYVERAWLNGMLQSERESLPKILDQKNENPKPAIGLFKWAAVAALGLGLFFFSFFRQAENTNPPVATLIETKNCRWEGSELPTNEGAKLGVGVLSLAEGLATLQFESGATVTLEAPAKLEVTSKMRCRLLYGSAVAEVPETAHGFTIDTSEMEVVDLGTKFGLTASEFGSSHVIVFEGEVEVQQPGENLPKRLLREGSTLHYGKNPPSSDREFSRSFTLKTNPDGWTEIPTSHGKGKDSYFRRADADLAHGSDPMIMVKHSDVGPKNERRSCLSFDLSDGNKGLNLDAAKLTLEIQSSGLGFSALIPSDSHFAVYGVLDDKADNWNENTIKWVEPSLFTNADLPSNQFIKVGEFDIVKGASKGQVEVSSPELARFVQADKNRIITFLIVRETGESDPSGLVHAFASKEHPNARPPTLWLKASDSK